MTGSILLLCNEPLAGTNAKTINEHLDSLRSLPGFDITVVSMLGDIPRFLDLDRFNVIGIHYTLHLSDPTDHYISKKSLQRLHQAKPMKCIWLHDEYRRVDSVVDKIKFIGIDLIFTLCSTGVRDKIYSKSKLPNVMLETVLPGYVSDSMVDLSKKYDSFDRKCDVAYRARRPPIWLGKLGQEKINIATKFADAPAAKSLVLDLSVEECDRLYGTEWLQFLSQAKAGLLVESGSSIVDYTGELETESERLSEFYNAAEIQENYLQKWDGLLGINCLSPRVFEQAACNCLIIAYPGHYSGILKPGVHYVELKKDFSNIDKVVDLILNDDETRNRILAAAYQELISSGKYSTDVFQEICTRAINQSMHNRRSSLVLGYSRIEIFFSLAVSPEYILRQVVARLLQYILFPKFIRRKLILLWFWLPSGVKSAVRPSLKWFGR